MFHIATFRYFTLFFLLLFSIQLHAQNKLNLKAELGPYQHQLNSEPSKFFYQLGQIKNNLSSYDTYSQEFFWAVYCETANRMELYSDVVQMVDVQLSKGVSSFTPETKSLLLLCRADAKQYLGKTEQSILDYKQSVEYAVAISAVTVEATALMRLGQLHAFLSHYSQAQELLHRAFKLSQQSDNNDIKRVINAALGGFYAYKKDYDKAESFYQTALKENLAQGYDQQSAITLYNLGVIANQTKQYEKAINYLAKSLELAKKVSDIPGIAYAELQMSPALTHLNRFEEAKQSLEIAFNFFSAQNNENKLADIHLFHGKLLVAMGQLESAQAKFERALSYYVGVKSIDKQSTTYLALYELYLSLKQVDKALDAFEKYHALDKSLSEQHTQELSQRMLAEFQYEIKSAENNSLKNQLDVEQEKVKQQQKAQTLQITLIVVAILLIVFVLYHLYRQYLYGKKMRSLAMRDELTQVPNRRAIMTSMSKSISWSLRYQHPLSVAMFDIDYFKKLNDSYGHDVGDTVLKTFAQTINDMIRTTDDFGRIGGEEFLLIMPNTSAEQAKVLLSRIMPAIKAIDVDVGSKRTARLTASAGLAEFDSKNDTMMDVYNRADTALYLAKESGRDQYKVSQ